MLAVGAVSKIPLRSQDRIADFVDLVGCNETQHIGQAREGLTVSMAHSQSTTGGDIVANEFIVLDDRDEPKVLGKNIHVVRGRKNEACFEFTWQVGIAIHRLLLGFSASDQLLIEVDLVVGASFGKSVLAPGFCMLVNLLGSCTALMVRSSHHVAIHIATGGDGVEKGFVHPFNEFFYVALKHSVKLKCLASGQTQGWRRDIGSEFIKNKPLCRSRLPAG